nr:MAG TPA: hypothetical protein [Bacteriophage sp.]
MREWITKREKQHYVGKRLHFRIYSRKAITYLLMVVEKC